MSPSPRPLSVVPVEGMATQRLTHSSYISFPLYYPDQTDSSIQDEDEHMEAIGLPEDSQDITSLYAHSFVGYMNKIGWPQDGTFMALLSNFGYHFHEKDGRTVTREWSGRVAPALSLLISEL